MNPLYRQQQEEMAFEEIGREILELSRTELYMNLRFLDVALSGLTFVPDGSIRGTGTDGVSLFYRPDWVAGLFGRGSQNVNRSYLHTVFHCLFGHVWNRGGRDREYWDLALRYGSGVSDRRSVSESSTGAQIHVPQTGVPTLSAEGKVPTAEQIYRSLCRNHPSAKEAEELRIEFTQDDHRYWEREQDPEQPESAPRKWEEARERMQTEMELFSKEASREFRDLERTGAGGKTIKNMITGSFCGSFLC